MQTKTIVNPSQKLRSLISILSEGWVQTCHTGNCNCFSHDSGYTEVVAEVSDEVAARIRKTPHTPASHESHWLEEEGWPEGLPKNAPDWACTSSKIRHECGYCHGTQPRVETDGDFTVVKLMEGRNSCVLMSGWETEKQIFATRDGVGDHTAEYKKFRFLRRKTKDVARFEEAGLTTDEAHRLFGVGKEQWAREFEGGLLNPETAAQCRSSRDGLCAVATAHSRNAQERAMEHYQLAVGSKSYPRTQAFAVRALWVFHGLREVPPDFSPAAVRPFPTKGTGWRLVTA